MKSVTINGKPAKMMTDTGASCSIISDKMALALINPSDITPSSRILTMYNGSKLETIGQAIVKLGIEGENLTCIPLLIVKSPRNFGLLGRDVLSNNMTVNNIEAHQSYLPTIRGIKAHMKLKPGAQAKFCPAREVWLARSWTESKLWGVIRRCDPGGVKNASPVVWVKKSDGSLRMCPELLSEAYPMLLSEAYPMLLSEASHAEH
eukprot:Pompholyxophrys_punicea_v1_NODE_227_length_2683_cov_13.396650.p3 type:complete len:205 gc:universal NODE_227_length_2683_cov_13.396650:2325-1711(-)